MAARAGSPGSTDEQVADGGDVRLQLPHAPHAVLDLGNDLRLAVQLLDAESSPGAGR